jgi:formylglycine-generating enzyme required for sulfatase activity
MKIKNVISILVFLVFCVLGFVVVRSYRHSEAIRQKQVQEEQQKQETINTLLGNIESAEKIEDYYTVVRLSKELLKQGQTNNYINLKISNAEQKIVERELAPVVKKATDLYARVAPLKGVLPYYTLQVESIDEILEDARDYEFSKDYDLAADEYKDAIKQSQVLQALEIKRLGLLKSRRGTLRLSITIDTNFKVESQSNQIYKDGQEYLKRAELAYQLAKFDVAQSDYNAATSRMKQALDYLTKQKEFKIAKQKWNNKVFNTIKLERLNSELEFYDFLESYASNRWTNLKSEVSKADIAASTNNFTEATIIYKSSLLTFDEILLVAQREQHLERKILEEKKQKATKSQSKKVLPKSETFINEGLVISDGSPFNLILPSDIAISMLPIKSGACTLGSSDKKGAERIQYQIILTDNFWCSESETTLAMFLEFLNAKGISAGVEISPFGAFVKNKTGKLELAKNKYSRSFEQPMFCVDWNIALKFCEWLNDLSKHKRPDKYVFRLPTEAEWTYSAMYEEDTTNEETLEGIAWYSKNSSSTSHDVCGLEPNEFGLYDMYGNVWEWCLDSYEPNFLTSGGAVLTNKVSTSVTDKRVVKGGSWDFTKKALKPLENMGFDKNAKQNAIGFRVILAPQI